MPAGYQPRSVVNSRPLTREALSEQLRRFNEERERQLGKPPSPDERLPLPFSGVGGDVPPEDFQ